MNIGIDIKVLSIGTGIATYITNICNRLQKTDKENYYFLFTSRNVEYKIVNPKWRIIYRKSLLPGTLWVVLKIPNLCKKYNIDVFWGPEFLAPVIMMKNIKVIPTIHDLACILHPEYMSNIYLATFLKSMYPLLLKNCSSIITVSNFTKKQITKVYGNRISEKTHVIYNGTPDWQLPKNYDSSKRTSELLFIGNQEPRKNLLGIVRALLILKNKGKNYTLNVIGPKGWKSQELFSIIRENKLNINVTGYVDLDTLKNYLLTCKALLFPSLYEGFGVPILEALQLDCVTITSEKTVMEEIVHGCAIFCDPYNPESIAEKISEIYSKNFSRDTILKNAKQTTSKYDWEQSTKKHLELFTKSYNQL